MALFLQQGRTMDYPYTSEWRPEPEIQPGKTYFETEPAVSVSAATFRGRGPKNYRRPDDKILEEVCRLLANHESIDATEMDVDVVEREVTLTGTVQDENQKRLAVQLAKSVWSVFNVHNDLMVTVDSDAVKSDSEEETDH
jgi:hypothetical protein